MKGSLLVDKVKGGSYTDEQYRSLSEQHQKVPDATPILTLYKYSTV